MRKEKIEHLVRAIDDHLDERLFAAEMRHDAKEVFVSQLRESDFLRDDGPARLPGFLRENGIDGAGIGPERLAEIALEIFGAEAESVLDPSIADPRIFVLGAFPIGPVEVRIRREDFDPEASEMEWAKARRLSSGDFDGGVCTLPSERVWYAVIRAGDLRAAIAAETAPALEM